MILMKNAEGRVQNENRWSMECRSDEVVIRLRIADSKAEAGSSRISCLIRNHGNLPTDADWATQRIEPTPQFCDVCLVRHSAADIKRAFAANLPHSNLNVHKPIILPKLLRELPCIRPGCPGIRRTASAIKPNPHAKQGQHRYNYERARH